MKAVVLGVSIFILLGLVACRSSSYPCPRLSTTGDEGSGVLTKKSVAVNKNGLVKKKTVKRKKRR